VIRALPNGTNRSLGNTPIRPRLIEVGLLDCNLRFGLLQGGLCIDPLRLRLVELHLVVARIDQHQQLSGGNMLVVDKLQLRYPARHLQRQLGDVAVDERIVGAFEMPRVQPPDDPGSDQRSGDNGGSAEPYHASPRRMMIVRLLLRLTLPCRVVLARNGVRIVHRPSKSLRLPIRPHGATVRP